MFKVNVGLISNVFQSSQMDSNGESSVKGYELEAICKRKIPQFLHFPAQWCYTESWFQIKQYKPNLKILVAICTAQINTQGDSKWPNLIVWGHPQYKTFERVANYYTLQNRHRYHMIPKNDALENVSPCKCASQVGDAPPHLPVQLHCQHRTTCFAQLVQGAAHAVWCHGPV